MECGVCGHTWFQSRDRILDVRDGFEMTPYTEEDFARIELNKAENKPLEFKGSCKLYVGNLAYSCTEAMIRDLFQTAGTVGEVAVIYNQDGTPRGFAFVTMRSESDGNKAIDEFNQFQFEGRNLNVKKSNN